MGLERKALHTFAKLEEARAFAIAHPGAQVFVVAPELGVPAARVDGNGDLHLIGPPISSDTTVYGVDKEGQFTLTPEGDKDY